MLHGNETFRYGPLASDLINEVFTKDDEGVIVRSHVLAPRTNIFPIIMQNINETDATYGNDISEIMAGRTMFKQAAIIVALEVTIALMHRRDHHLQPHKILIVAFYKTLLRNFRDYLTSVLGDLVKDIAQTCFNADFHEIASVDGVRDVIDTVVMWEHGEVLMFKPVQNAHGTTATVTVAFLCRRQKTDRSYQGDATNETYIFQLVSRMRFRFYCIIEDMCNELVLPSSMWEEATSLGLRGVAQYVWGDAQLEHLSKLKRQFRIVKLLNALWRASVGHIHEQAPSRKISHEDVYVTTRQPQGRFPTMMLKALREDINYRESSTSFFTPPTSAAFNRFWVEQNDKYDHFHKELNRTQAAPPHDEFSRINLIGDDMDQQCKATWRQILSTKVDCGKRAPAPIVLAEIPDELRRSLKVFMEDGHQPDDFGSGLVYEDETASLRLWSTLTIDCLMVHFKVGKGEVLVEVPVLRCFEGAKLDAHHCIKGLWGKTFDLLFSKLKSDPNITVSTELTRHKKDEHQYGKDRFTVTLCGSDRVGFDIIFKDKDAEQGKVVFHMYPAMGVDMQSVNHTTLLARCYDVSGLGGELSVAFQLWCIPISL